MANPLLPQLQLASYQEASEHVLKSMAGLSRSLDLSSLPYDSVAWFMLLLCFHMIVCQQLATARLLCHGLIMLKLSFCHSCFTMQQHGHFCCCLKPVHKLAEMCTAYPLPYVCFFARLSILLRACAHDMCVTLHPCADSIAVIHVSLLYVSCGASVIELWPHL